MISSFVHGKVYVFIDVSNVFYSQRTLGWKVAYAKLMRYLKRECGEGMKCFAYAAVDENNLAERKFLDMLDINGYILRTKALKEIKTNEGNKHKGSLDIELAFEMVELAEKYDTAVLVSGDSDFAPALERLKQRGKRVIVMSTRGRVGKELLNLAKFVDLRKLKAEISQ
ncbi:MAG: NYN domain-containing protein [Patescibacteria group bacterium]